MRPVIGPGSRISLLGIAIAIVSSCGGDGNGGPTGPQPTPPPASVAVTTGATPPPRFIPASATVAAGGTVKWTNGSPAEHNLTAASANWQLNQDLPVGGTFTTTIAQPGTYRYQCTIHEGMAGTIVVK